jgi:PAS domain S-box-containing protein
VPERLRDAEIVLRATEAEIRELRAILDTATDGVIVTDREGLVLSLNRSAEALFGYEYHEMARRPFGELFAPRASAPRATISTVDQERRRRACSTTARGDRPRAPGRADPAVHDHGADRRRRAEVLRRAARHHAVEARRGGSAQRQAHRRARLVGQIDFLAKISHEIRTPLNAIIGFSEVMMQEQFGPIGSERYREYMRDIQASGEHLVSLINDLLDLSKIEAGKLDLVFASVNLNDAGAAMRRADAAAGEPAAHHHPLLALADLPPVMADARSVRQIVLNLLSNSIKFTGAGGQVIVSTALTERGEASCACATPARHDRQGDRDRDGAVPPARDLDAPRLRRHGARPALTKALAEANRASFAIKSAVDAGTLVEITFAGARVGVE